MYNYGSEALELEYLEPLKTEEQEAKKKSKREERIAQRIEELKKSALKSLAVVSVILTVIMVREAQIDKLCGQITNKEKEVENLNAVITEKEIYISGKMNINTIEDIAINELGMVKPTAEQTVTIDIRKEDGGEVLVEEPATNGGFAAFINKAKILLEYLY